MTHTYGFLLLSALLNAGANVTLKTGLQQIPPLPFGFWMLSCVQNIFIWGGVCAYVSSMFFWMLSLSKVDMSCAVSFLSLSYVLTIVAGVLFFKEPLTGARVAGVLMILGGMYFVSRNTDEQEVLLGKRVSPLLSPLSK